MKPNLFISYSRREVGFVDALFDHLEKEGYDTWLDYRSLVPGKPWEEQIYQGITNANVILLVISKASIASDNVEMEWKRVLKEKGKRIILLIFESMDLPPELENFEWVDFRGNYKDALEELDRQLQAPEQEEHPAPQKGFKVPSVVWWTAALSLLIAILSLFSWWTVYVPLFLVPLPYRIFKRNFNFLLVTISLITLPLGILLTRDLVATDQLYGLVEALAYASIIPCAGLFFLLRSRGMQRWGKPEALPPMTRHARDMDLPAPKPVEFFVEHAPQDRKIADEMRRVFASAGHKETADASAAQGVFTLLSKFKTESSVDCDTHVVYPVVVQSNRDVSRQLSRIQWLDFRSGVRNLSTAAKLLPEPAKLLKALGIRPSGNQTVMPAPITYLIYFIAVLAVICIGSWLPYIKDYGNEIFSDPEYTLPFLQLALSMILFGVLSYFIGRNLVERKGPFASLIGLLAGMLLLGVIVVWQVQLDNWIFDVLDVTQGRGMSSLYPREFYTYGILGMAVYLFFKRRDLMYWFPARAK